MHTTILLLEPDHDLNRLFQSVLQTEGYRVHALHRWEDAQLMLSASMPHLIIFDWVGTTTGGYQWLPKASGESDGAEGVQHHLHINSASLRLNQRVTKPFAQRIG